jgi:hypothetical protein
MIPEEAPEATLPGSGEAVVVLVHHQHIEHNEIDECHNSRHSLLPFYAEYVEKLPHQDAKI